mmetsp:Transcript_23505/g.26673  ORF Transcript_23505/g.26673 Transcript_23505/m.26673 type:complete len:89 (-) Transcript_23505:20-286(-)
MNASRRFFTPRFFLSRSFSNLAGVSIETPAPLLRPGIISDFTSEIEGIESLGRNSRVPKRANHGARPCSHIMRRLKKKSNYRRPQRLE